MLYYSAIQGLQRMKSSIIILSLVLAALSATAQQTETAVADTTYGYKDAYKDYFSIGVSLSARNVRSAEQMDIVKRNFNSITAENAMKPGVIHPKENVWRWGDADSIANWCRRNGVKMRGHCLCWHEQFSNWMFTDSLGNEVTKEVFYQRLRNHIHTVVGRYKDVVYAWDVLNEAIADGEGNRLPDDNGKPSPYRQSRLFKLCGEELVRKVFEFAHEADPDAKLFYNDYNAAVPSKRDRIYNMVKKMKDDGVPIDGIGMQGHYNAWWPSAEDVEAAISKYSEIVDEVQVTELDIRTTNEMGGQLQFSQGNAGGVPQHIAEMQERQYANIFRIVRKWRNVVTNVTFWNLSDADSWLGAGNSPLPFDTDYKPKSIYYTIRDFNPANDIR